MIEVFTEGNSLFLHSDETDKWSEITPLPGHNCETLADVMAAVFEEDFERCSLCAFAFDMLYCDVEPVRVDYAPKLKVGHLGLEDALSLVDDERRVDFNSKWSLEDALRFDHAFPPGTFDYLEDPTPDIKSYAAQATHPIAIDKYCSDTSLWPYAEVLVIKPPWIGGIGDCLELVQSAHRAGKKIVISNPYQTLIGLRSILSFIQLLNVPLLPAGLGDLSIFHQPGKLERIGVVSPHSLHI